MNTLGRKSPLTRQVGRLESVTRAQRAARFSAAVRLLSDADLTGLIEWMDTPEGQGWVDAPPGTGPEPPAPLWAAWLRAWERATEGGEPEAEQQRGPLSR